MRILVAEDEQELNRLLRKRLKAAGYSVDGCMDGEEVWDYLAGAEYDALVLDIMMPKMDGIQVLEKLRRQGNALPVLLLTARDSIEDRVRGLDAGADDYLVKPFDLDELLARIEACLRRARPAAGGAAVPPAAAAAGALAAGRWALDPERRSFCVDGAPVRLTRTEFDIVRALMEQPDRVFTKRDLYRRVDHDGAAEPTLADEKTVTTHVGNLRAKLKASGTDSYVETVWGIGFKLHVA